MPEIILPATAKYNIERERMATRHHALQDFERQLTELDEHSTLVRAHEQAAAPGMIPGFWHVKRTDPVTGWDAYLALTGPDGQFSEPHSGHLQKLREADLQRSGGFEELKRKWEREDEDKRKALLWTRGEFQREFAERYLSKTRPSVSFQNVGGGWRNRV